MASVLFSQESQEVSVNQTRMFFLDPLEFSENNMKYNVMIDEHVRVQL